METDKQFILINSMDAVFFNFVAIILLLGLRNKTITKPTLQKVYVAKIYKACDVLCKRPKSVQKPRLGNCFQH